MSLPRPVAYQTRTGAEAACHRAARHESPTQRVTGVEYAPGILRAYEGGIGFEVVLGNLDWEMRTVSAQEIEQRVQAGIRYAVTECYEAAAREDVAAANAKTASFRMIHSKWAADHRSRARGLELKLTISGIRQVVVEPIWSSERDHREAGAL